jgi:hypothetical protein
MYMYIVSANEIDNTAAIVGICVDSGRQAYNIRVYVQ